MYVHNMIIRREQRLEFIQYDSRSAALLPWASVYQRYFHMFSASFSWKSSGKSRKVTDSTVPYRLTAFAVTSFEQFLFLIGYLITVEYDFHGQVLPVSLLMMHFPFFDRKVRMNVGNASVQDILTNGLWQP